MADDERRRLLKRIEALEEASAAIRRELASVKDAVEGLTEEPSGQPARETEPAASLLPCSPSLSSTRSCVLTT